MMPETPDPAAVLGCALSLHAVCLGRSKVDANLNLSAAYGGGDEFMRQVMRVANLFEEWACEHVDFEELGEVWPYFLEDGFGEGCLARVGPDELASFNANDCLRVALRMRIPIRWNDGLRLPVDLVRENPVAGSGFVRLRIRTMCGLHEGPDVENFSMGDDPFDGLRKAPFFSLYGLDGDGLPEHIADRNGYAAIRGLALKLAPGVDFPEEPKVAS